MEDVLGILMIGGLGGAAIAILVAKFFLKTIGFTAGGVAAESIASRIQHLIGKVSANSIFASFQSVGALGSKSNVIKVLGIAGFILGIITVLVIIS